MARPMDPRSRSAAARLLDVPEATLRSLESRKIVEPVSEWGPTDVAWAKAATTLGVDAATLPPVPKRVTSDAWLILPNGSGRGSVVVPASDIAEVIAGFSSATGGAAPVICLPVGAWAHELGALWVS